MRQNEVKLAHTQMVRRVIDAGSMTPGKIARRMRASLSEWLGLNASGRRRLDGSCAAILNYHRVLPERRADEDFVESGMYVTPESFAMQLDWLSDYFQILPLYEVGRLLAEGNQLPERACAITFDDGWYDNFEYALPELSKRNIPATVFVVTRRVGSEGAFWPDDVCRRLASLPLPEQRRLTRELGVHARSNPVDDLIGMLKQQKESDRQELLDKLRANSRAPRSRGRELMNWDELDQLGNEGVDVESHCATHAILTGLSLDEAVEELCQSRDDLRARGHGQHGLLAYPSGSHNKDLMQAASQAGYRAAVTIENGLASANSDLFALPRLCVHQGISGSREEFLFKIPGRA